MRLPSFGIRVSAADRAWPGAIASASSRVATAMPGGPRTTCLCSWPGGGDRSRGGWKAQWIRTPEVTHLQTALDALGAELVVDGICGPATDTAVRTFGLPCRRDRVESPLGESSNATMRAPWPP